MRASRLQEALMHYIYVLGRKIVMFRQEGQFRLAPGMNCVYQLVKEQKPVTMYYGRMENAYGDK